MLVISTATKKALIAIENNGQTLFKEFNSDCKYSENLLNEIDEMLEKLKLSIRNIESFAIVIGPGSFTGLRIGVSLLKGLLASNPDMKVLPLSTLDFMAYSYVKNEKPKEGFSSCINALSGRYFSCDYDKTGKKQSKEKMFFESNFFTIKKKAVFLEEESESFGIKLTAQNLLDFAKQEYIGKNLVKISDLTPVYIRKSQAEEMFGEN